MWTLYGVKLGIESKISKNRSNTRQLCIFLRKLQLSSNYHNLLKHYSENKYAELTLCAAGIYLQQLYRTLFVYSIV
jgi:hypothetical protein